MLRSGSDRPSTTIQEMLHSVGMRATVQRIALARLLLRSKNRRVTAEILYNEALEARCPVSRGAVYNTLRQFERAGLLRRITVHGSKKAWFGVRSVDWPQQRQEEGLRREN
jgi:Fur family transcriptional regulator, iron response regulator